MNNKDMQKVLHHLRKDPVVKAVYDAKSEEIGPNIFRFKAEIGAPLHSMFRAALLPAPLLSAVSKFCRSMHDAVDANNVLIGSYVWRRV